MDQSPTELELLRAELAELRAEVATMRDRQPESKVAGAIATVSRDVDDEATEDKSAGRRGFLRLAGAAAVGGAAVAVAGAAKPAAATTGNPVIIGQSNTTSAVNDTTRLYCPSGSQLDDQTFRVDNYSDSAITIPSTLRIAVSATTSGSDNTNGQRIGLYGRTSAPGSLGGQGVFGSSEGPENPFGGGFSFGVVGTAGAGGYGVFAYCDPASATATGVLGRADAGVGVVAASITGVSLLVRDGGRLQQQLRVAGAPTTGAFTAGEQIRDAAGDLYICTVSGSPGTWRKVTAQHPAFANAGGSINLLSKPIRLVDSRGTAGVPITNGGVKFAPGTPLVAQITGTVADGLSVPAGAKGILGNLTATESNGPGFALVWPSNVSIPSTSNINYSAVTGNPAIANYFISGLDTTGKLSIQCAANATHLLLDVFGFVF